MVEREEEFKRASFELGEMIDRTEGLDDLSLGEINEMVCGVNTEECDAACGGALCTVEGKAHGSFIFSHTRLG